MIKKISFLLYTVFFLILFTFFYLLIIERNPQNIPSALLDKEVPIFEAESLIKDKNFISSELIYNKITIVNFFATWCKPCRDEHKYIKLLSSNEKLNVIGINYKDNKKKAKQWLKELGNPYSNIAIDKKGNIAIDWGVYGIPETFLINSEGIIKYKHVGPIDKNIYNMINLKIKNNFK